MRIVRFVWICAPLLLYGLDVGWNLVGAKLPISKELLQKEYIQIVWRYKDGVWSYFGNFDAPYPKIERIEAKEGFWVLSTKKRPNAFWLERGVRWYWQLQGELNMSVDVDLYDVDLFETTKAQIEALHDDGKLVICYFSAGSFEAWRPDAANFDEAVKGKALNGWDGEYWLDIRSDNVKEVMRTRLDLAKAKGCDGVEPDNVDGYQHDTGFALSSDDQLAYNHFLATEAHKRGLLVGLKNDLEQIEELVDHFDFAVNEECFVNGECEAYLPFLQEGKAVLNAEYEVAPECKKARLYGISAALFAKELDGSIFKPCF